MENRRSEGRLVTLQYCTAISNIPAGTPLGLLTGTNNIYTLGKDTTGLSNTANLGGAFIGISDEDLSAGDSPVTVWTEGVFEMTASSAWATGYIGDAVEADSGKVVTDAYTVGNASIGSYIPAGSGERSGKTVLVKIRPIMWEWDTIGAVDISGTSVYCASTYPRQL